MNTKHSPTPWTLGFVNETVVVDANGQVLAGTVGHSWQVMAANASHIVTAVNAHEGLVEALKTIAEAHSNFTFRKLGDPVFDAISSCGEIARAALTKAGAA